MVCIFPPNSIVRSPPAATMSSGPESLQGALLEEYRLPAAGGAGASASETAAASTDIPQPPVAAAVAAAPVPAVEPDPLAGLTDDTSLETWCTALGISSDIVLALRISLGFEDDDKFSVGLCWCGRRGLERCSEGLQVWPES